MITEDYCSFELSKLLKEKGFDVELQCDSYYEETQKQINIPWQTEIDGLYPHCTHALAMKWLRCKEIYIEIDILGKTNIKYGFTILKLNEGEIYSDDKVYTTYEEAVEAALKYVLEKLI